ncbi:hypothetical protein B0H13DRAFT_1875164 [Mycena leptocephala]|nr:hypothetical protein B0H13DRAFT_1875164 [Mycena leptocephala]
MAGTPIIWIKPGSGIAVLQFCSKIVGFGPFSIYLFIIADCSEVDKLKLEISGIFTIRKLGAGEAAVQKWSRLANASKIPLHVLRCTPTIEGQALRKCLMTNGEEMEYQNGQWNGKMADEYGIARWPMDIEWPNGIQKAAYETPDEGGRHVRDEFQLPLLEASEQRERRTEAMAHCLLQQRTR